MSTYSFRGFEIPDYMMDGLQGYIESGIPAGGFLTAVLENNLMEAVGQADDTNIRNLPAYVAYLYNEAPRGCFGSPEIVEDWIVRKSEERAKAENA